MAAAGAVIRDPNGRVLLVEPNYKQSWEIPGGVVDEGESPRETCARELREELAMDRVPGRLLVVDHCRRPHVTWEGLRFVFDGGVMERAHLDRIALPSDELRSFRMVEPRDVAVLVSEPLSLRLAVAIHQVATRGPARYLENGFALG